MVEWSDALNHRNQYELNLLQQKVDERDQLIVQKDATIAEKCHIQLFLDYSLKSRLCAV